MRTHKDKRREPSSNRENLVVVRGRGGGGAKQMRGIKRYELPVTKQVTDTKYV